MTYKISHPSESLSRRILSPVPFKERYPAGRLKPPVGIMPGDVRSLSELHEFLAPDEATLPGINLKGLPGWIEMSIGDGELAASIQTIVDQSVSYVEGCIKIYEVVGVRLVQARKTIKEDK